MAPAGNSLQSKPIVSFDETGGMITAYPADSPVLSFPLAITVPGMEWLAVMNIELFVPPSRRYARGDEVLCRFYCVDIV